MGLRATHPAITALRSAHEDFRAYVHARGETTHICYDSDLRHDERDIATKLKDQPFVWIIGSMSTHLATIPSEIDCYIATRQEWTRLSTVVRIGYVLDALRPRAIENDWIRAFVWDNSVGRINCWALHRMTSTNELWNHICMVVRDRALSHLKSKYAEPHELLATGYSSVTGPAQQRIAEIDRDIAIADVWGPDV